MTITVIISLLVFAVLLFAAFVYFGSRRRDEFTHIGARLDELSRALYAVSQQVDGRLREAAEVTERGHQRATDVLRTVTGELGEQREALRRIVDIQRDLRRFQDLLQPPKSRGGIGEKLLERLLSDVLPKGDGVGTFSAQYAFKGGERVDFILRLKDVIVPIDAKFPVEAFERLRSAETEEDKTRSVRDFRTTVKQHIEAVSRKYIHPDEGTADFAFLYIPSEAVYLAFTEDGELMDFAFLKRVIVVSPGTFLAYLRTVLVGLAGLAIESSAKELLSSLGRIEGELREFTERFRLVGVHLRNAVKVFEDGDRQLIKLTDTLERWREGGKKG